MRFSRRDETRRFGGCGRVGFRTRRGVARALGARGGNSESRVREGVFMRAFVIE